MRVIIAFKPLSEFFLGILFASTICASVTVNPLPKPREITWGEKGPILISFDVALQAPQHDFLQDAWLRVTEQVTQEQWIPQVIDSFESPEWPPFPTQNYSLQRRTVAKTNVTKLNSITIDVQDLDADLQHGVDESYIIELSDSGALKISSQTVWGALHAFNTLSQIVISDDNGGLIIERTVLIKDSPIYPHRGLLLDTARNFYPVRAILRTIDAMAWCKLNVLHWHVTDTQSWPLKLDSYKEMTKDAYSKREIYNTKDVKLIINYARKRGVRVMPELDMPGHARAGYQQIDPSIIACGDSWWSNDYWPDHTAVEPPPGQLDIINNNTYTVIKKIFTEVANTFPEKLYHAGFDELQRNCYNYSDRTMQWFAQNPDNTWQDLAQYFLDRAYPIFTNDEIRGGAKRIVMWEDVFLSQDFSAKNVPKDIILQTWNNGVNNTKLATSAGYDVIVSSSDFYYLDCGFGGWVGNDPRYDQDSDNGKITFNFAGGNGGSWCNPYKTWQRIYDYDITFNLSDSEKSHVLGGEVALWSEQADETVVDSKIWPRTAAFAESMWSGNKDKQGKKRYREMQQRINEFRERLVARGVGASPLQPKFCYTRPHQCDLQLNVTAPGYD